MTKIDWIKPMCHPDSPTITKINGGQLKIYCYHCREEILEVLLRR